MAQTTLKERMATIETEMTHVKEGLERVENDVSKVSYRVEDIVMTQIPNLKESINQNKWHIGLIIGGLSTIGTLVAQALINRMFGI